MTLGHGVWLNEKDIDRLAAAGACVCHNCSSNFRLRSGVAALNIFEAKGINTAIGLDEAGINDDRDMLQEMRWCCAPIACPAWSRTTCRRMAQVLRMATVGRREDHAVRRAASARWKSARAADMVLIDWEQVAYPYLDERRRLLDAVIQRAKNQAVHHDMCDGEVIYQDGKFTKVDATAALQGAARRPAARRWPTTRSSGASSRRRCCRMCGSSTPTTSTPNSRAVLSAELASVGSLRGHFRRLRARGHPCPGARPRSSPGIRPSPEPGDPGRRDGLLLRHGGDRLPGLPLSPAIRAGEFVFVSGMTAKDPTTGAPAARHGGRRDAADP